MRPQPHNVHLVLPFVVDPGANQLLAEDAAGEQELVVGFERVQGLGEGARHLRDTAVLLEEVPVGRLAGVQALFDSVQTRHQHRREGEVGVCRSVGAAELDPLRLGRVRVHRDPDAGRAVPLRVNEVDRRLVTGHEPAVRVGRRRTEGEQCRRMREQSADVRPG